MSAELVPINGDLDSRASRIVALEELARTADSAASPEEADEIMRKARALADALAAMKAPLEEACLAGKASVLAARRLGLLLAGLSNVARGGKSDRTLACEALGITPWQRADLVRLSRVSDPDFQRYIQRKDKIPTLTGVFSACAPDYRPKHSRPRRGRSAHDFKTRRRKRAGVKSPANPSLDEGYSLIVRALGHLSAVAFVSGSGSNKRRTAISAAIDHLYAAEDLLKPYRGGYGG